MVSFGAGNTGAQMGGWFRKEIKTLADLKGLKMRIGGAGALPLQSSVSCRSRSPAATSTSAGKRHDRRRGVGRSVRRREARLLQGGEVLLLPGLVGRRPRARSVRQHQGVGRPAQGLPGDPRIGLRRANIDMLAKYDALNPQALKRLIANGVKLQPFSNDIMAACYKATQEVYDEIATKNEKFKKIYEPWKAFGPGRMVQHRREPIRQLHDRRRAHVAEEEVARRTAGGPAGTAARRARRAIAGAPFIAFPAASRRPACRRPARFPAPWSRRPVRRLVGRVSPCIAFSSAFVALSCSCSGRRRPVRRNLDPYVPGVDLFLLREAAGDEVRDGDDQPDHDDLDQHERHRAPVDLPGGDRRHPRPVIRSTYSLAGATLRR